MTERRQSTVMRPGNGLTYCEMTIMRLLYSGLTCTEIAEQLCSSIHTVRFHGRNIYKKLMVHNRIELVRCVAARLDEFQILATAPNEIQTYDDDWPRQLWSQLTPKSKSCVIKVMQRHLEFDRLNSAEKKHART